MGYTKYSRHKKKKNEENAPSLEVAKLVLVQYNLVDSQINKSLSIIYLKT